MSEEKTSQSLSISGSQLSDVQIGMAGKGINQKQQIRTDESSETLTREDVVELIAQLENLFRDSGLPEAQAVKAIKHLEAAKEEAQDEKPDKEFAAKSLQRATKVLKEAGETVEAGNTLWQKVQPLITRLLPWLGVAASFFM